MLAPTHSVFGLFLTLIILALFGIKLSLHWSILAFSILGAIIPDIDTPKSTVGRIFYFVSAPLERRFGHRTITHSFVGLLIFTLAFFLIIILPSLVIGNWTLDILSLAPRWLAAFSISYFSHIVLDMFNKRGSQLFWPDTGRDVIPRNPKFRLESGAKSETVIFIILLALVFLALPISKYGIASSLRWLLATPSSAIQEFKSLENHSYLNFKGVLSETKQPIEGTAEILDADRNCLVILFQDIGPRTSDIGQVFTLSDEISADIIASSVRVKKTQVPIKTKKIEFKERSRDYLLSQIPKEALVSGTAYLPQSMDIDFSRLRTSDLGHRTSYKTIEQQGSKLILRFATKQQLANLALDTTFDLQLKGDKAELAKLNAQEKSLANQIKVLEAKDGLTPLGRQILGTDETIEKNTLQIEELQTRLDELRIKKEEVKLKIASKQMVFSGEVYIRE